MPQKANALLTSVGYTQLTNADVSSVVLQVYGPGGILLQGRAGAGAVDDVGAILFTPTTGLQSVVLSELFPDISGVNRLYARARSIDTEVVVRHA